MLGLVPPLLLEAPKRAVKFAANDFWGKTYLDLTGEAKMTQNLSILTGCSAGATVRLAFLFRRLLNPNQIWTQQESFVVVPFELVKIKLQDKTSTFKGPMDVVKQVIKKEGVLGLYAGMESTFWRHVYWNGGYFGCIFQVKALLPKPETQQAQLMNNFISGAVGGFAGTVLNTPFDVVKSRIQGTTRIPGVVPKYNWTYPALVTIFREEGAAALYKGFVPKVLRLAPGGGVLLLVVEFTLGVFRKGTPVDSQTRECNLNSLGSSWPPVHMMIAQISPLEIELLGIDLDWLLYSLVMKPCRLPQPNIYTRLIPD
ncbi:hypothetical protein DXG01_010374 [Tephrocybe rancida]|nr:hypothetical protein DXG01_010374 [Tephrocybe rancida]